MLSYGVGIISISYISSFCLHTAPGATPNTGFIGESIKLNFLFSENLTGHRHFVIHRNISGGKKIAEYTEDKDVEIFEVFPQNKSVSWKIEKLQLNHSGLYWASFFKDSGPVVKSDRIQLSVTEKRENTTGRQQLQYTTLLGNYINTDYRLIF